MRGSVYSHRMVSVPLRGKEGAGQWRICAKRVKFSFVSVPLRGKEGAGLVICHADIRKLNLFPSPCGVRRVRDNHG